MPRFLTETVSILDSMSEIDCVFTIFEVFGIRSGIMRMGPPTRERIRTHQCIPATGVLMRREVWEKVGGYCEDKIFQLGNEDWDFWIRAMEAGCKPYEIEKPLYRYRTSPNSLCTKAFYVEHRTRQHLIERHPFFFANRSVTRQFLADGYALSSDASLMRGEKVRAIRMAFREICLRPISTKSWRHLLRILCPDFFVKTVKRLKLA
jgi:GT2 family glycosyltransferase